MSSTTELFSRHTSQVRVHVTLGNVHSLAKLARELPEATDGAEGTERLVSETSPAPKSFVFLSRAIRINPITVRVRPLPHHQPLTSHL
jgi:hypothetical protein